MARYVWLGLFGHREKVKTVPVRAHLIPHPLLFEWLCIVTQNPYISVLSSLVSLSADSSS